jgi:glycosyltransferase involved in cell wall biosynthesis
MSGPLRLAKRAARLLPPDARRLVRRIGRGAARRVKAARAAAVPGGRAAAAPLLPATLPAPYRALLTEGLAGAGTRGCVVLVCDGRDPAQRRGSPTELWSACGLAHRLQAFGFGVTVRSRDRWDDPLPPGSRAVVVTAPGFDPGPVPDGVVCAAWVVDDAPAWRRHPRLALFDVVLAASPVLVAALTPLTDAPVHLFPLAADEVAFAPGTGQDRAGAVAPGGRRRPPRVAGVLVTDDAAVATGTVPLGVFAAVASGRIPVTASRLGLADSGLGDVPTYRSTRERATTVEGLRADPEGTRRLLADLRRAVYPQHTWTARARALADLLADLPEPPVAQGHRPTVGFFPDFRVTNPYQDMLYATLPGAGVRVAPVRDVLEHPVLRDDGRRLDGYVLHLHWTSAVVQVAPDEAQAQRRLDRFREQVHALKARGGRVLWTVHNVLPHELAYRDLELQLCRFLAEQADLVHVMGPATFTAAQPYFPLDPARVVEVPHSSYTGIYPDLIDPQVARHRLGIADGELALLALGGIRPYRGLDQLLDVFDRLQAHDPRLRLLVAGKPGNFDAMAAWQARCEADPRIVSRFEHLPEHELQVWHAAADLAVLPYRAILNSGAFKLAQTFGLPIVAPRDGCLADALDPAYAVGFDPDDAASLEAAVAAGIALASDPDRAAKARIAARADAEAYPPQRMAEDFGRALLRVLGHSGAG